LTFTAGNFAVSILITFPQTEQKRMSSPDSTNSMGIVACMNSCPERLQFAIMIFPFFCFTPARQGGFSVGCAPLPKPDYEENFIIYYAARYQGNKLLGFLPIISASRFASRLDFFLWLMSIESIAIEH
jgi:hypothetical protein